MAIIRRTAFVPAILVALCPAVAGAAAYIGAGSGIVHTSGPAFQLAAEVYHRVEIHVSAWRDDERVRAAGVEYRFDNGSPLSVALGVAHVNTLTPNLLRHANAYVEVRVQPFKRFSCQISHYSSVGDDDGENLLLCGIHWP